MFGAARLLADLRALGYEAELVTGANGHPFVVIDPFEVLLGRFAGRMIGLGLQGTPDFPRSVSSAIHVRSTPHLLDLQDSATNVRNIQPSELGAAWRYWSKNFGWTGDGSARRLISQVNQILKDA